MLKKAICLTFSLIFLTGATVQSPKDGLYLNEITIAALEKIYSQHKYSDAFGKEDGSYPRIFLKALPKNFEKISDSDEKNNLFIMILAPLALKLNEEILSERNEIIKVKNEFEKKQTLNKKQIQFIEEKAKKYDIFTRLKDNQRLTFLTTELILKVDTIPPSVLIASAAIDTDWGTSRAVLKANNLYKQLVWYKEEKGLKPEDDEDAKYEIKIFKSLYDSMEAYALKINSGVDFYNTRHLREEIRFRDRVFLGSDFAHSLLLVSNLKNFIGILDYTITFYALETIDQAKLEKNVIKN